MSRPWLRSNTQKCHYCVFKSFTIAFSRCDVQTVMWCLGRRLCCSLPPEIKFSPFRFITKPFVLKQHLHANGLPLCTWQQHICEGQCPTGFWHYHQWPDFDPPYFCMVWSLSSCAGGGVLCTNSCIWSIWIYHIVQNWFPKWVVRVHLFLGLVLRLPSLTRSPFMTLERRRKLGSLCSSHSAYRCAVIGDRRTHPACRICL